jgi:hypothetical protein
LGDLGDPVITNWTSGLYEYLVGGKNRERIITTWGKHSIKGIDCTEKLENRAIEFGQLTYPMAMDMFLGVCLVSKGQKHH